MAEKKSTAHTEHPGGGKQDFPPFQKDTFASQLVWLVLIFGVLYLLMSRVALPRIGQIMASRQDRIEADLAEARRLKDESDAAIAAYEKALADARSRAQALAAETHARYAAEAEAARKALDNALNARITEAERIIASKAHRGHGKCEGHRSRRRRRDRGTADRQLAIRQRMSPAPLPTHSNAET